MSVQFGCPETEQAFAGRQRRPLLQMYAEHEFGGVAAHRPGTVVRMDLHRRIVAECVKLSVPVNELHAKCFASIGCAPCTRAIRPGEPERAGRWWWESDPTKECGLHLSDGKLARSVAA